jgi:hypothetical protein
LIQLLSALIQLLKVLNQALKDVNQVLKTLIQRPKDLNQRLKMKIQRAGQRAGHASRTENSEFINKINRLRNRLESSAKAEARPGGRLPRLANSAGPDAMAGFRGPSCGAIASANSIHPPNPPSRRSDPTWQKSR